MNKKLGPYYGVSHLRPIGGGSWRFYIRLYTVLIFFFLFSTSPAKGVENKERRKDRKKGKNKQDPAIVKRRKMMKILEN